MCSRWWLGQRFFLDSSLGCALVLRAVKIHIKSRTVTVQGPRGTLRRDFKHLAVDMSIINGGKQVRRASIGAQPT